MILLFHTNKTHLIFFFSLYFFVLKIYIAVKSIIKCNTVAFQSSCSFSINSSIANATDGDYAVALQIEDFANSSSSTPLSSVPLQFIITVQNWGYCFDSASFVYPTPAAGETLHAQNGSLQFHARAFTSQTK